MKKFKFRLEALLRVREHAEREKQKTHAKALHMVQKQRQKLQELQADRHRTTGEQRAQMTGRLSVADMLVYSRYLQKIRGEHTMGEQLLAGLDKDAEAKRQNLVEASKQRKIYEQLKAHRRERHYKELEGFITKDNDEIAIGSHRQKDK
ncbi:MAG: flagellar export protein FliJ [bacterium]